MEGRNTASDAKGRAGAWMWGLRAGCSIRGTARSICGQAWLEGWEEPSSAREEGQDPKGPLGEQRGRAKVLSFGEQAFFGVGR